MQCQPAARLALLYLTFRTIVKTTAQNAGIQKEQPQKAAHQVAAKHFPDGMDQHEAGDDDHDVADHDHAGVVGKADPDMSWDDYYKEVAGEIGEIIRYEEN